MRRHCKCRPISHVCVMRAFALLLLLTSCASDPVTCRLEPLAVLPVAVEGNVPVTVALINGRPATLILDIGSDVTLLSRKAARRLGVAFDGRMGLSLAAAGGVTSASPAILHTLQLGTMGAPNVPVVISQGLPPPIDGVLGIDILAGFEVDLDGPNERATIYRARLCSGAAPNWTEPFTRLPTQQQRSGHLFVPAQLNGRTMMGLLDTGASRTTIGLKAAADAGLTKAELLHGPASRTVSLDADGIVVRPRRFRELRVGSDVIDRPILNVAALPEQAGDFIVGGDYLATRRVWIALATGSIFVSAAD